MEEKSEKSLAKACGGGAWMQQSKVQEEDFHRL